MRHKIIIQNISQHLKHIDEQLSYKGVKPLKFILPLLLIVTYANKNNINNIINNKAKYITQNTIEDDLVKLKAQKMLTQLISSPETKQALFDTFNDLFNDPESLQATSKFIRKSTIDAFKIWK